MTKQEQYDKFVQSWTTNRGIIDLRAAFRKELDSLLIAHWNLPTDADIEEFFTLSEAQCQDPYWIARHEFEVAAAKRMIFYLKNVDVTTWEEIFQHYGRPFTSGRDLWDFLKENYSPPIKFAK